ncbi:SPOR domain-containing protein [Shewanella surugensis]|uniref:SPOR domain-containing protein n=1 Tax=Shewanella surugensis TaxID=212020 RepID=A0ABT0LDZ3_9GAMM|nr:SPOR domain-containing protein [Shewanella surugensis]MCL1125918.1 SPOR domain-containing protein [Shewanella surugensis]
MTSRDYANRNPQRNKKGKKKSGSGHGSRRFPFLILLITALGLAAFIYLLWSISGSPTEGETIDTVSSTKEVQAVVAKPDPDALPPAPQEKWTYLEELENKQVEVDLSAKRPVKPKRPYQIQCASFRKEEQADSMKATIAFQGLEAIVRKVQGTSGMWYKVVLGPYDSKRLAEKQRHILQRGGLNGCQIWLWEG